MAETLLISFSLITLNGKAIVPHTSTQVQAIVKYLFPSHFHLLSVMFCVCQKWVFCHHPSYRIMPEDWFCLSSEISNVTYAIVTQTSLWRCYASPEIEINVMSQHIRIPYNCSALSQDWDWPGSRSGNTEASPIGCYIKLPGTRPRNYGNSSLHRHGHMFLMDC